MAQIEITNLTFCYEGSSDNIFEDVSFSIDTDWKLGFLGRNGKGKTTFLKLLLGEYEYSGKISSACAFDYFPYPMKKRYDEQNAADFLSELKFGCEEWKVVRELNKMDVPAEILYRPFGTLSHGERTKLLLAVLFSGENDFLLIDEPTNHLDQEAREVVKRYLQGKKSFILVSHDRDLLDACVNHVLVLNRKTIEVQNGNFSSWWENKLRKDEFAKAENEKHLREIAALKKAADKSRRWAEKNESTKIGYNPIKEHDRSQGARAYIGSKTKKMQSHVKQYERRVEREIALKEGLLSDIEEPAALKLCPLSYHKEVLVRAKGLALSYGELPPVFQGFEFVLQRGERVFLHGKNGCGKSTFLKAVLENKALLRGQKGKPSVTAGWLVVGSGLICSYINQDTSFLQGDVRKFCEERGMEESLFFALLRQLDMERTQFVKPLEDFSEGQKKKVLIAASLMTPAHLYVWDEPLNYIDVFSRIQIEKLLLAFKPTMLVVEHDARFQEKIATRVVEME